jgi:hypothetical protein
LLSFRRSSCDIATIFWNKELRDDRDAAVKVLSSVAETAGFVSAALLLSLFLVS